MIWKKKNNLTKKNNHVKNDSFQCDNLDQFNMIDLGEEYFISPYEEDKLIAIPELKDINTTPDKKVEPMINLSYPDDVKYVHKKYQRGKIKKQRKLKKTKKSLTIVLVICFIILGLIIYEIVKWQKDNIDTKKQIEDINKEVKVEEVKTTVQNQETPVTEEEQKLPNDYFDFQNMDMISVDFDSLLKRNSDTKGWIKVPGTSINYPFVQTNNNDYYLTHSFNKKNNDAGWVYLDYRNNINNLSQNTIIYGHGRLNNTMFGSLKKVVNKSWYTNPNNYTVKISTPAENSVWQVFSTYTIEPESYYITTNFNDSQAYTDFINKLKSRSVYNYNVDVTSNDKILTLSSCYNDEKRVVLHAKLVNKVGR